MKSPSTRATVRPRYLERLQTQYEPPVRTLFIGMGGKSRRAAILSAFQEQPSMRLPVNGKWQISTSDADLKRLLRQGLLRQVRDRGRIQHAMNKSSRKRQTFLVLA